MSAPDDDAQAAKRQRRAAASRKRILERGGRTSRDRAGTFHPSCQACLAARQVGRPGCGAHGEDER